MKHSIGLGAFGTFGNPYGFQQKFYHDAQFNLTLDLNPNAIELNPNSEVFVVKKELNNGIYTVCFCVYSYARESQSSRKGSFIGSCIVFENCIAYGNLIYECLHEFHNDLINDPQNLIDNVLQVNQAKDLIVKEPHKYQDIVNNVSLLSTKHNVVNYSESFFIAAENLAGNNLNEIVSLFFTQAVETFPTIGTLYLSTNSTVIEYVKAKGLIPLASLEEFVEKTKSHLQSTKRTKKEKKHSPKYIQASHYEATSEEFYKPWDTPQSPWNMNEVRSHIEEHNNLVTAYKNLRVRSGNAGFSQTGGFYNPQKKTLFNKEIFADFINFLWFHKTITILSIFLLLITWAVIVYLYKSIYDIQQTSNNSTTINASKTITPSDVTKVLEPQPTGELNEDDLNIINKNAIRGMTAIEITNLVIRKNPTDVGSRYETQKSLYAKEIIKRNNDCFDGENEYSKSKCDKLKHIPIYKP